MKNTRMTRRPSYEIGEFAMIDLLNVLVLVPARVPFIAVNDGHPMESVRPGGFFVGWRKMAVGSNPSLACTIAWLAERPNPVVER